ncbi:MAG: rod shape-determining protein MreC [Flavobacteriaceae bacterium]|nr:rod shape-determining protein MreC [Flavobacteriaceae bacterium]
MQQLVNAIIRFRNGLVYLLLISLCVFLLQQSSAYHRSLVANVSVFFGAEFSDLVNSFTSYTNLRETNKRLLQENQVLLDQILSEERLPSDTLAFSSIPLQVIRNSFINSYNYITLKGGKNSGVKNEMGLVTAQGIVGVVQFVQNRYAQGISILNKDLKINAKLKNSNHFGSLTWKGDDPTKMKLFDVPKTATIKIGDTIQTGGMSTIFPPNLPIGSISNFVDDPSKSFYDIQISLFQDMTNLGTVFAIDHPLAEEVQSVQKLADEK